MLLVIEVISSALLLVIEVISNKVISNTMLFAFEVWGNRLCCITCYLLLFYKVTSMIVIVKAPL